MSWKDTLKKTQKRKAKKKAFKLEEGENTIRILPSRNAILQAKKERDWDNALESHSPCFEFLAHRDVGPEKRFVRSGKDPDGSGECWLTDVVLPALLKSNSSADRKAADAMKPQEQFCVQVSCLDHDGDWSDAAVWYVPRSLQGQIIGMLLSTKRQYDHPSKGFSFNVMRTGQGMQTRYGAIEVDHEPSKIPTSVFAGIMPWTDVAKDYLEQDQRDAFGEDVEEEEQTARPKRKAAKKQKAPEHEPEDDDDFGDEDEAEAPEPKRSTKRKTKQSVKVADVEDNIADDNDEEDFDGGDLPF